VLALPPDHDTLDLVARAERWASTRVLRLWPPRRRWHVHGRSLDAALTTLGDVAVAADPPLGWALGHTRAELRSRFQQLGLSARPCGPHPGGSTRPPIEVR
jgi:hypothetical protein